MNEEILAGIKNAIAHGFSIEEAANSFINAGNNSAEVNEVVSFISKGISPLPTLKKTTEIEVKKETEEKKEGEKEENDKQKETQPKPQKTGRLKLIFIILITLIALGIILSFLLFRDKFLGFIDQFFP